MIHTYSKFEAESGMNWNNICIASFHGKSKAGL